MKDLTKKFVCLNVVFALLFLPLLSTTANLMLKVNRFGGKGLVVRTILKQKGFQAINLKAFHIE